MMIGKREEDYLEAIYNIVKEKSVARVKDIAEELGIRPPSVTEMLQKLDSKDLIRYRRYEGVRLTKEGEKIGEAVQGRHKALLRFLTLIEIPDTIADKDACAMEHGLDPITIIQLKKFIRFVDDCPKGAPQWVNHFKEFSKTGLFPEECIG